MNIQERRAIERRIVTRVIQDALAAGYEVAVHDGQQEFGPYNHTAEVLDRMFSVDDEHLRIYSRLGPDKFYRGFIRLIYGNDGHDVIADYTAKLEDLGLLAGANKLADEICNAQ